MTSSEELARIKKLITDTEEKKKMMTKTENDGTIIGVCLATSLFIGVAVVLYKLFSETKPSK